MTTNQPTSPTQPTTARSSVAAGATVVPDHHVEKRGRELRERYRGTRDKRQKQAQALDEASQRQLVLARFRKHRVARICVYILGLLYLIAILAEFVAPYDKLERFETRLFASPTSIHIRDANGHFHLPFIYSTKSQLNMKDFTYMSVEDEAGPRHTIRLFAASDSYKLLGVIPMKHRLFGTDSGEPIFLLGADHLGRDQFSRIVYAARISLFVGLAGVAMSFVFGITLGGISGYFGGVTDMVIQRLIEFIMSIPQIPLWMALSAAIPLGWTGVQTFFAITLILSLIGWTDLARVVRGKVISLREEDYVTAARISSARAPQIIVRHLLPGVTSYLVVSLTLAIPFMILGETALSFLGLGITPPDVSWGSLLQEAQDVVVIANYPWLLAPAACVMLVVVLFNFIGDGLRDAVDPYSR